MSVLQGIGPAIGRQFTGDVVFMGTPDFAATILEALIGAGRNVLAVYTQPPRPAGRGHRLQASPVQALAERHGLAVRHPNSLRDAAVQAEFAALRPDVAIVAAYGLILPTPILAAPRLGCVNVHASLLPRWRGAAPVQRAILEGDAETGITIMQMDAGLDTGAILLREAMPIGPDATGQELTLQLARLGAGLMLEALDGLAAGGLAARPQPVEGAIYAKKLGREEGRLDWRLTAAALKRRVRAFDPWPGAFFEVAGKSGGDRIRVLAAEVLPPPDNGAAPGTVLDKRLSITCGTDAARGVLRPLRLQRPGRSVQEASEFLRGFPIPAGTVLPCPAIG